MKNYLISACVVTGALLVLPLPAAAAAAAAASCGPSPAALVQVEGFKARTGRLRVYLYGSNPADFLVKGKRLKRITVPVTETGPMNVCVPVPRAGRYAIVVQHDLNHNKKRDWSDGGGASRNPPVTLLRLKPSYDDVAFNIGQSVTPVRIMLKYRSGLGIAPVRASR